MKLAIAFGSLMIAALGAAPVHGDDSGSGFTFSLMGGSTVHDSDIAMEDDQLYGGRVGYIVGSYLHIEGLFDSMRSPSNGDLGGEEIRFDHYGLDLVLNPLPNRLIEPYLTGGYARLDWRLPGGGQDYNGYELGGGLRLRLAQGDGWRWDLRADAREVFAKNGRPLVKSAVVDDTHNSLLYSAGLQLSLGGRSEDSDGDGVVDEKDRCANTPLGAHVDLEGCPKDGDGDGVWDGLDRCPATPQGARVDAQGCPQDGDGDRVFDGLDRCPSTAAGVPVDAFGCTKDSDGDGVHDGLDRCPDTKLGAAVDAKGCPLTKMEREMLDTGMIRLDSIYFQSGKAILKTESYPGLDEVGAILVKWPELKIEVGGHTDAQGSAAFNERLSGERASAVRDYLLRRFSAIQPSQLEARGYGESQSIADNNTAEGRARNRRVEFKVLNRGLLSK